MPKTRRRLDINACTVDDLEFVEGMTRPLAKRIIAYRNRAGCFNTISELAKVRGVGDRMLSLISKHVYVLPPPPSPRSRRSSLASSRANSPQRGRSRRSTSHVSFISSRHSPSPIRRKSPKREVARTSTRRSERVMSRSNMSLRSSRSSPSLRNALGRSSPKHSAMSAKKKPKSGFKSGPVYVDSAQNVSIDLGKLAKEGCNLTLHGGASDGQVCPFLTINVKELDRPAPSADLTMLTAGKSSIEQRRSPSLERVTQGSSVIDENVREYLVIRDTKRRTTETTDDQGIIDESPPRANMSQESSPKRRSPQKIKNHRDRSGDYRKRSRSRSTLASSRRSSPKKGSPRRSRSGSRHHSPPRSRRRHKSPVNNDRLSRSDIENWLQEGSAPLRIDRGNVNVPLASSTPRRSRREKRERRSPSPIITRSDVAGPSRIGDNGRESSKLQTRSSPHDHRSSVRDGRRSRREDVKISGRRDSESPRRKLDLEDDVVNARGLRRYVTESISQTMDSLEKSRGHSRSRQPDRLDEDNRVENGDVQDRRHHRRDQRHRSKTDRDPHRRAKQRETDSSYAAGTWCAVV